jgi:hypothetical protein
MRLQRSRLAHFSITMKVSGPGWSLKRWAIGGVDDCIYSMRPVFSDPQDIGTEGVENGRTLRLAWR